MAAGADPPPPSGGSPATAWGKWAGGLAGCVVALAGTASLAPHVPVEGGAALFVAAVLAFACVSAEVLAVSVLAPRAGGRALVVAVGAIAPLGVVFALDLGGLLGAALVTVGLLAFGTVVGAVIGARIEAAGHLIVVAAVSALVDVFSVLHPSGPTHQIVRIEAAVNVLVLPWPILGTDRIEPMLGVGDVAFAALYVAAARRHGLSVRRTVLALAGGLAATLLVVLAAQTGIPALPFLGAGVVVAHPEARRVPKKDRRAAALGLLGLGALFLILFLTRAGGLDG